jgi:hypothetical protein
MQTVGTHMNKILYILTITALVSCGSKNQDNVDRPETNDLNPFELTITDYDYSMAYGLQYVLTEKDLKIIFKGELEGEKDTILFSTDLQVNETLRTLANLDLDNLKGHYNNPCIDDGSQISVDFKKDNKTKAVYLSNYYQKDIGIAIELINGLTPKKYKIWYDKNELLQDQKDCEEGEK